MILHNEYHFRQATERVLGYEVVVETPLLDGQPRVYLWAPAFNGLGIDAPTRQEALALFADILSSTIAYLRDNGLPVPPIDVPVPCTAGTAIRGVDLSFDVSTPESKVEAGPPTVKGEIGDADMRIRREAMAA